MNDTQKAALLLSGLHTKTIDTLLSRLDSETARTLLRELRTLPAVSEQEKNRIAEEFRNQLSVRKQRFRASAAVSSAGINAGTYRRPFYAAGLHPQVSVQKPLPETPEKFNFLNQIPPEIIAEELINERPQTIAAVLSHLPVPVRQNVLPHLPLPLRNDTAERLPQSKGIMLMDADLLADIESALRERFQCRFAEEFNELQRLNNADLSALFHSVDLMTAMLSLVGAAPVFIQRVLGRFSPTEEAEMKTQLRQLDKIEEDDVMNARIKLCRMINR